MLVFTTNAMLFTAVRKACDLAATQHGILTTARRLEKFEDLLEVESAGFLILDLATCLKYEPGFVAKTTYAWRMLNPRAQIAMLTSTVGDHNQGYLMYGLAVEAGVRTVYPIQEGLHSELWVQFLLSDPFNLIVRDIRTEFESVCDAKAFQFPNRGLLHTLLEHSMGETTVEDTIERIRLAGVKQLNVNRHWLWNTLRSANQLPPSHLCTAFRVAGMLKMRQETELSVGEIAQHLGFSDSRQMMLRLNNRTGFGQKELARVPYPSMLEFSGSLSLPEYPAEEEVPAFQDLIRPLVEAHQ